MKEKLSNRQVWVRGGFSALIAAALNVAVAALLGRLVEAPPDFLALQPGPVVTVTIAVVAAGTVLAVILTRFTPRTTLVFSVVASAVAVVSLAAPIALSVDPSSLSGATPAAALTLISLHLIPAAVLISALAWRRSAAGA